MKTLALLLSLSLIGFQAQAGGKKRKPAQNATSQQVVTKQGIDFVETNSNDYHDKVDFAEVEASHPISKQALQALTPQSLRQFSQEELDQIYARLTAGPIPDGAFKGEIIFEKDGGLQGLARYFHKENREGLVDVSFKLLQWFGEYMWKGKHFYKEQGILRNLIPDEFGRKFVLEVVPRLAIHSSPKLGELPKTNINGQSYFEIFPAKLYCGQSLLDSRRESIIIDYAYTGDVPRYNADIDILAGNKGLNVRDEIRMIRPGLYLGRAYIQKAFGLIFVLSNDEVAKAGQSTEECWVGTQARK